VETNYRRFIRTGFFERKKLSLMTNVLRPTDVKFCAWCSSEMKWQDDKSFATCEECGRKLFPNHKPCTAIILESENKILLVRRNTEPKKGFLDLPGGFIDITDLSAEEGASREAKEELGLNLTVERLKYIGSNTDNSYVYQDMGTPNLIFYYSISLTTEEANSIKLDSENSEFIWVKLNEIENHQLAFDCFWEIIEKFKEGLSLK